MSTNTLDLPHIQMLLIKDLFIKGIVLWHCVPVNEIVLIYTFIHGHYIKRHSQLLHHCHLQTRVLRSCLGILERSTSLSPNKPHLNEMEVRLFLFAISFFVFCFLFNFCFISGITVSLDPKTS